MEEEYQEDLEETDITENMLAFQKPFLAEWLERALLIPADIFCPKSGQEE